MVATAVFAIPMLIILLASLALHISSFAFGNHHWVEYRYPRHTEDYYVGPVTFGLWEWCNKFICVVPVRTVWLATTTAMMVLALLGNVSAAVGAALYVFIQRIRTRVTVIVVTAGGFLTVCFSVAALSVFGVNTRQFYERRFILGFYLAAAHCALSLVGAILGIIVALVTPDDK